MIHHTDPWLTIHGGDCREVLRTLEPDSVHCVITDPPYWGLRDYGTEGQLGLEATPDAYVASMVEVFREVRRVLRPDGTLWLNLGDSYANQHPRMAYGDQGNRGPGATEGDRIVRDWSAWGLAPKQLVGIPWRVAFALQADGWYLRSDIIWAKPNPMPESVTDRPTKAHEYLFLLSKSARYYYDADAVREANVIGTLPRNFGPQSKGDVRGDGNHRDAWTADGSRNLRSVWTIATAPYPGAHFATFPPKLVEPCVKAGTSERGVCPDCGAPWARVLERTVGRDWNGHKTAGERLSMGNGTGAVSDRDRIANPPRTIGWRPTCGHGGEPVPAVVLDPFAGTGTVGLVAQSLSRRALLIDLNPEYLVQCLGRNRQMPLGVVVTVRVAPVITEAQFLRQVRELAALFSWRAYHPQLSKWSERGWPDVALCRPPRFILAELKSEFGKVTPQQTEWLADLARCPGVEVYLWRPSDFERIVEAACDEDPVLLDLFCGAGGAAKGYADAGFDVVGVDIDPQPHYPYEFIQADWEEPLSVLPGIWEREGRPYAIHASPPCQLFSTMRRGLWKDREHPNLIPATREWLQEIGVPYVIENVENARRELINPVMLCGTMFGLGTAQGSQLRRHRYFETTLGLLLTPPCAHNRYAPVPVYGGGQNGDYHTPRRAPKRVPATIGVWGHAGGSSDRDGLVQFNTAARREAMGIDWMTGDELSEAIPPAYTEWIGARLLETLAAAA